MCRSQWNGTARRSAEDKMKAQQAAIALEQKKAEKEEVARQAAALELLHRSGC